MPEGKRTIAESTRAYKYWRSKQGKKATSAPATKKRATTSCTTSSAKRPAWTSQRAGYTNRRYRWPAQSAPRAHAGFNPSFNRNIVFPHSISPYVKVHSRTNGTITTNTSGQEEYLIVFYSDTAIRGIKIGGSSTVYDQGLDALNTAECIATGPLGLAVNLRNVAKADSVSGSIRVLVTPAPMLLDIDDANNDKISSLMLASLRGTMSSNPNVKTYTAQHFRETKTISSYPANAAKSMDYTDFHTISARDGGGSASEHNNLHIKDSLREMSMAAIIIQFNLSHGGGNQYEWTIHDASRVRFAEGSVMSSQHTVPRPISQDAHTNAVRQAAAMAGVAFPMPSMMQ